MATRRKPSSGEFLLEWLADYETARREFESSLQGLSESQLDDVATNNGFRTWRLHRSCMNHHGLVLKRFVEDEAFARLWGALADYDKKYGTFAFSAANGGVPATILRRLDDWYRTPKFTPLQLTKHYKKIAACCDELLHLLLQVTPGEQGDRRFVAFNHFEPGQADFLLRSFQSPPELGRRKLSNGSDSLWHTNFFVAHTLERAGITPIAALEQIRRRAASAPTGSTLLPTKLGAKGAMRTYFINATFDAINNANSTIFHAGSITSNQLLADLVCLIADTDCNADDVRKALAKH